MMEQASREGRYDELGPLGQKAQELQDELEELTARLEADAGDVPEPSTGGSAPSESSPSVKAPAPVMRTRRSHRSFHASDSDAAGSKDGEGVPRW